MLYKCTVSTIVSYTAEVEADSAEEAEETANERAKEFGNYYQVLPDPRDSVDFNDEWQYGDPETVEVQTA